MFLTPLDWAIVAAMLVLVLGVAAYTQRLNRSVADLREPEIPVAFARCERGGGVVGILRGDAIGVGHGVQAIGFIHIGIVKCPEGIVHLNQAAKVVVSEVSKPAIVYGWEGSHSGGGIKFQRMPAYAVFHFSMLNSFGTCSGPFGCSIGCCWGF